MARTAWRCLECGTINEPGARACRECGNWPSLFDLQDGAVGEPDVEELEEAYADAELEEVGYEEPDVARAEAFEPEVFEVDTEDPAESAGERPARMLRWAVFLIAMAVVLVQLLGDLR